MKKSILFVALAAVLAGVMSCSPRNLQTASQNGITVNYDGIEYKFAEPTREQLDQWMEENARICTGQVRSLNRNYACDIPVLMMEEDPCLPYLILHSKSISDKSEKQSWFDLYSLMDEDQLYKLYDILYRENYKLGAIKMAYQFNEDAYALARKKDFDGAHKTIDKAIALFPDNANYYDSKGEFYQMQGKTGKAVAMWKKVVALDPDFLSKHNGHSGLYDSLVKAGKVNK